MGDEVSCAVCGAEQTGSVGDWTVEIAAGRRRWVCPACTRQHVRTIEAQLDLGDS